MTLQLAPLPWHSPPQSPLVHSPGAADAGPSVQATPLGWQGPQKPAVHRPEQHCPGEVQGCRSLMHIPVPQTPFEQESLQQSVLTLQLLPIGEQLGLTAHVPLTQDPVQQLPSEEQLAPAGAQTGEPPAPPVAPLPPPPVNVAGS